MSDTSGGFSTSGSTDRLSAMRASASAPPQRQITRHRGLRIELVVGILLIVGGIAVALYLRGAPATTPLASLPSGPTPDSVVTISGGSSLLAGEVAVSFAVDDGHYPPSLRVGDVVRLVVTPTIDGTGDVRTLSERTVVVSIDGPSDSGTRRVVTVRGPESILTAVVGSGPVHVALLGGAQS